jgi:hypothetical protein
VAVLRALSLVAAVSAFAALPCLLVILISLNCVHDAIGQRLRRRRARRGGSAGSLGWRDRRRLARLDKSLGSPPSLSLEAIGPPIEKLAADIRRLRRQRTGIAQRSPVWFVAVERAYDERVRMACRQLGIDEHLDELTGFDREIERVRLEGELEAAGVVLHGYEAAAS